MAIDRCLVAKQREDVPRLGLHETIVVEQVDVVETVSRPDSSLGFLALRCSLACPSRRLRVPSRRSPVADLVPEGEMNAIRAYFRRRALRRAWSRGELEFAGAMGRSRRPRVTVR